MPTNIKFVPEQKYKKDKDGNFVLDDNGEKIKLDLYKGTTFEDVVYFLRDKGTDKDRAEFKKNCFLAAKRIPSGKKDKDGKDIMEIVTDDNGNPVMEKTKKTNWLYAKKKFFEKYAPEYITVKKKVNKADLIKDW